MYSSRDGLLKKGNVQNVLYLVYDLHFKGSTQEIEAVSTFRHKTRRCGPNQYEKTKLPVGKITSHSDLNITGR